MTRSLFLICMVFTCPGACNASEASGCPDGTCKGSEAVDNEVLLQARTRVKGDDDDDDDTLGEEGSAQCPDGATQIADADACKAAAEERGVPYFFPITSTIYPGGCFLFGTSGVFFNEEDTGAGHDDMRPLCAAAAGSSGLWNGVNDDGYSEICMTKDGESMGPGIVEKKYVKYGGHSAADANAISTEGRRLCCSYVKPDGTGITDIGECQQAIKNPSFKDPANPYKNVGGTWNNKMICSVNFADGNKHLYFKPLPYGNYFKDHPVPTCDKQWYIENSPYYPGVGDVNSVDCPAGTSSIADEEACKKAAKSLTLSYQGKRSWNNYPGGCMQYASSSAYFNTPATEGGKGNCKKICAA